MDDLTAERLAWLGRFIAADDLRNLRRVLVNVGYCETCSEYVDAVRGEYRQGATWAPFCIPLEGTANRFPRFEDLDVPHDDADDLVDEFGGTDGDWTVKVPGKEPQQWW